jgi:hypothetical protein
MFLNNFVTRYGLNNGTVDMAVFSEEVNLLDALTSAIPLSVRAQLTYSDNSQQNMLLAFAVNKIISETQILTAGLGSNAQIFFTQYNSVNGLDVGCDQAGASMGQDIKSQVMVSLGQCKVYLIICCCLFVGLLLVKNLVLRQVLLKKAEILNIFF